MKATFKDIKKEKFNISDRKEKHFNRQYSAIVFNGKSAYEAVTLRIYSTDAKCYCCLWVNDNCTWAQNENRKELLYRKGSGSAGGYGYHRASAAAANAIEAAGIELDEEIAGRGNGAMMEAVKAIAEAMWPEYYAYITEANP